MNVFVQRMIERIGDLDEADAVAFAEQILSHDALSVPAQRQRNLALAFLKLKYPFQCCSRWGKSEVDERCPDCPMPAYDVKAA
jgi:hypothetical protein